MTLQLTVITMYEYTHSHGSFILGVNIADRDTRMPRFTLHLRSAITERNHQDASGPSLYRLLSCRLLGLLNA